MNTTSGKRVLAINSSMRKKNTRTLLHKAAEYLAQRNIHTDIIDLKSYTILPCTGCEHCIRGGECPLSDDVRSLMQKMTEYDGFILSSPVYMGMVTGTLKNFIDRTCVWYHRPQLTGKSFLSAATTMGSRLKETLEYLDLVGIQWGMIPSGRIGRSVTHMNDDISAKETDAFVRSLFIPQHHHKPSGKILRFYSVQKVLALKILANDRIYWQNKGWDAAYYYYPCRASLFSRLIAGLLYQLLNKVIQPQKE